jgi:hypothetical protein
MHSSMVDTFFQASRDEHRQFDINLNEIERRNEAEF